MKNIMKNLKNTMKKYRKYKILLTVLSICLIALSVCLTNNLFAQNEFRYVKNEAFGLGEKLEYKVGMLTGILTGLGGSGGISVAKDPVKITLSNGEIRDCYDINFWVDSEGIVDITYPIHDKYRTVVDIDGIFPYEFYQRIREGNFKRDFKARFDQIKNVAIVKDKQYQVEEYVQDILSALFYARTMDLSSKKSGDIIVLKNFYKDSTFSLPIKIIKREIVKVSAGKFRTILVQPGIEAGGLFKFNNAISIWLTDDERKIPVKVATSIVIGDVGAELYRYSGVRGKIEAKLDSK
jgi:hypothetical protein